MDLNWSRLCSLCWEKCWGVNFNNEGKSKSICLCQVRAVISIPVCVSILCVHLFTGQHAVDLSFLQLKKHFPCIIKGQAFGLWVPYKCQFLFILFLLTLPSMLGFWPKFMITIEGSKIIFADVSLKVVALWSLFWFLIYPVWCCSFHCMISHGAQTLWLHNVHFMKLTWCQRGGS